MATISKRRLKEASILTSFLISKRNEPAYSRTCKDRSEPCLFYTLARSKRSKFCLFHKIERSKRSELCLFHKLDRSKWSEGCLFHKFERTDQNFVYSTNWTDRSKARSVYSTNSKNRSGANSAYSRNRQDQDKKNELDLSKTNWGGIFKTFMEPRNQFQGIESASLCPGGPVQQPYSSSVPSPLRLF